MVGHLPLEEGILVRVQVPQPMSKIIIFDLDGVLVDSNKLTVEDFYNVHPNAGEELYRETLCGNFIEESAKLTDFKKIETPEEKEARLNKYIKDKKECVLFDGIAELVKDLFASGQTLCLNTSAGKTTCFPVLERHGILDLFDFLGTKEVSIKKTEKFKMIKEKYSVDSKDMIFITDTLGDIREADHENVPTIAVTWGIHDHAYFNREPHENLVAIVDSVSKLRDYLKTDFI